MSEEIWKLEKDLCRCCHAEGKFKNLAEPCLDNNQEILYADMLKYCFNIDLIPVTGLLCTVAYTICEVCITSLQDAAKFKRNVAACEEKFKDLYSRVYEPKLNEKIEIEIDIPFCQDDGFAAGEDDDFDNLPDYGYEQEEMNSHLVEVVKKKRKKDPVKSRKKIKSKKKKKVGRPKKIKEEQADDGEKRKELPTKFRLTEEDYKIEGNTFACARCDKRYEKIFSLRFHVKTKHYKIPRFVCPYCEKEFMTPAPLTVHKLQMHNIDERFKCNACKGMFNTKVQLRKHINNYHMLGERYSCEFCEYESFSFESMYKHKFKHKTSKDHHCQYCKKSFVRKTTLDLHERIHTGDRRKICKICDQSFVQKASLNYHMTKYHPEINY